MDRLRVVLSLIVVLGLGSGCGGARYSVVASSPHADSYDQSTAAVESRSGAVAEASAQPSAAVRPGLATEWGETRRSRVNHAPFQRASSSPFASVAIRYNDSTGVAHQAAHRASRMGPAPYVGAYGDGIRISIVDGHGRPLPGQVAGDTLYVMGQHGQRYVIVLTNTTGARFEAVAAVDGLDVINGRRGSPSNRGYLLQPYQTLRIEGFRQSDSHVAAFRFGAVADSYAAQRGDARNVGVIGVALFAEAGWVPEPAHTYGREVELRETANPFPGHYAPPPPRRRFW